MDQYKDKYADNQVYYDGRWVNKENFRVFVYNGLDKKLANSYDEYCKLIESGIWFSSLDDVQPKQPINIKAGRKRKNGTDS